MKKQGKVKKLSRLNVSAFGFFAVLVLMMVSLAYGQALSVTVSASKTTGDPGDKITFTWKVTGAGTQYVVFDGIRQQDDFINKGTFTWIAEPGTHLMNVILRPANRDAHIERQAIVEISGNNGTFSHPGVYNSQAELDQIRKNVNGNTPHPMNLGWELMKNDTSRGETGRMKYTSLAWKPHAVSVVHGKTMSEKWGCFEDGRAAYAHALQWVVTKDQRHADKAIEILRTAVEATHKLQQIIIRIEDS